MVLSGTHDGVLVITLLPNRSATWAETRIFVLLICGTTLAIGLLWALVGFWMILPFSGLEAALAAWLIYRVCQATYQRQVITCGNDTIIVQFGTHFPKRSWTLTREHGRLAVTQARHPLGPPVLHISDQHHTIELGSFLNKDDKELALAALRRSGLFVQHFSYHDSRPR